MSVDLNNTAEVITVGERALTAALGADGARIFIKHYAKEHGEHPSTLTAAQLETIMALATAKIETMRPFRDGDFTAERHEQPERSHDEITAEIMRLQDEMQNIELKNPGRSIRENLAELQRIEETRKTP